MMKKYESQVQAIRYKVIKEIAMQMIDDTFYMNRHKIPKLIIPGTEPISRCCVYKEREIISERIDLTVDPIEDETPIIEVIDLACDECPAERYKVTEACRGCLANRCVQVCKVDAIYMDHGKAVIDHSKCISCGKCKEVCPFSAISDVMRPCKKSCLSKAINIKDNKKAIIDRSKCTSCGACVYNCPFGAITDRSEIKPILEALLNKSENKKPVYAVIAPSIASQYNIKIGKIVNAIKQMGFKDVVEAALGADLVAYHESLEFVERVINQKESCLMTSCCPSFVSHVQNNYPETSKYISSMVSPMVAVSRFIKKLDQDAIVVFIGPCTSKKQEKRSRDVKDATDYVMTFEELDAVIDAFGINISECEDAPLNNASPYGRLFARTGGVKAAIEQVIKEQNLDIDFKPIVCNGIDDVDKALKLVKFKKNTFNFIEGMACKGGCIGGPVCLNNKDSKFVDQYAELAMEKEINRSIKLFELEEIDLHRHF